MTRQVRSRLESWADPHVLRATYWRLTLTEYDAIRMPREQLAMLHAGLWLIEQALRGTIDGPLATPRLGLQVRPPKGSRNRDGLGSEES